MSTPQRLVAAAVALLATAGLLVVVAGIGDGPIAHPPSPTPAASGTAAPSPAESAAAPASGSPGDADILATLEVIEEQVVAIRGLPPADIGPAEIIGRSELAAELEAIFEAQYPPEERERDTVVLRALGLIGPDDDILELQLRLLADQVLGFYDKTTRRMVVVSDAGLDSEAKLTYAHEYAHALQDAAFGLAELDELAGDNDDRTLAHLALIEGDASVVMYAWAFANLSQAELLELGATPVPDTSGVPSWMVDQLVFPYLAGYAWVAAQVGADPFDPDFAAIDELYADPPTSTEQVTDPEAWAVREPPLEVPALDLAGALGEGWSAVDATPIGQATLEIMLDYLGLSQPDAAAAADGWGGDMVVVASGPGDAFAMTWRLAWDTAADADEFTAAYAEAASALPFPVEVRALDDDEVLVVHASDDATLRAAIAAGTGEAP